MPRGPVRGVQLLYAVEGIRIVVVLNVECVDVHAVKEKTLKIDRAALQLNGPRRLVFQKVCAPAGQSGKAGSNRISRTRSKGKGSHWPTDGKKVQLTPHIGSARLRQVPGGMVCGRMRRINSYASSGST